MKRSLHLILGSIAPALLLLLPGRAPAQTKVPVMAVTNGALASPTNFFGKNTGEMMNALSPHIVGLFPFATQSVSGLLRSNDWQVFMAHGEQIGWLSNAVGINMAAIAANWLNISNNTVTNAAQQVAIDANLAYAQAVSNANLATLAYATAVSNQAVTISNLLASAAIMPGYSAGQFGNVTNSFHPLGASMQTATIWGSQGTVMTNGNYRLQPWFSGSGGTLTNLAVSVRVASGNIRWGLYESTSFNYMWPSNLIFDSGTQAAAAAVMVAAPSVLIKPGRIYWSVVQCSAASALSTPGSGAGIQTYFPSPSYSTFTNSGAQPMTLEFTPGVFGSFPAVFPGATNTANIIYQNTIAYCVILVGAFR